MKEIFEKWKELWREDLEFRLMNHALILVIIVFLVAILVGCKTLETVKKESQAIRDEVVTALDSLGAEIVTEIANKVKAEVNRGREKLPMKIRREIERGAEKHLGLSIDLRKPPTEMEKKKTKVFVSEIMKTKQYEAIARGNTPVLEKKQKGNIDEANYTEPIGYKWIPSEKLKKEYFEDNPKSKGAREPLNYLMMAIYSITPNFLVYESHRSCQRQRELFKKGVTQIRDCKSFHNKKPSHAVDLVPLDGKKADWNNKQQYLYLAGMAKVIWCQLSRQHGWSMGFRHGTDWDLDNRVAEKGTFLDYPHFEVTEKHRIDCGEL